ncbi:cytochrome c biogenesis protein CcsA [Geofilum sp. OHC36d9]|uniref:cytochrome c biogenesis protein CcsA n=1 Tax=Geofilum sp. OHC36d9 TaxID=3458413 RepID=UPI0040349431
MQKILKYFAAPWMMGSLLFVLAFSMAMATFLESMYGTDAAKALVYNSRWFEAIFLLLALNMLANIIGYKMWRRHKIAVFLFHFSFFVIVLGAGITRYFGAEGLLAVREGAVNNVMLSADPVINVRWIVGNEEDEVSQVSFLSVATPFEFNAALKANDVRVKIKSTGFIPNAVSQPVVDEHGGPVMALTFLDGMQPGQQFLQLGDVIRFDGVTVGFEPKDTTGVDVLLYRSGDNNAPEFLARFPFVRTDGGETQKTSFLPNRRYRLKRGVIYDFGRVRLVLSRYLPKARMMPVPVTQGGDNGMPHAVLFDVAVDGMVTEAAAFGRDGQVGQVTHVELPQGLLELSYGAKPITLPFSIRLNDFILERYPGSESPSAYISEVTLIDREKNIEESYSIFMNNILNYRGYRLYQSSYDQDEKGTVLSVNHDGPGTVLTYLGYFLMALGMMLALIQPGTRFRRLMSEVSKIHHKRQLLSVILFFLFVGSSFAQDKMPPVPDKEVAESFGALWVQDDGGRIKPLNSLHQEVVVKLVKHNSFMGLTVDQVVLGMLTFPLEWQSMPMITVKHETLRQLLNLKVKKAAFSDFFNAQGQYLIHQLVDDAYRMSPAHRSKLQQELIKVDEQVNVFYLTQMGRFHKLFPNPANSLAPWLTSNNKEMKEVGDDSLNMSSIMTNFINDIKENHRVSALSRLQQMDHYQQEYGGQILPSVQHGRMERLYNRLNIFLWLSTLFFGLGLLLVLYQMAVLLQPSIPDKWVMRIGSVILLGGFIYYTFGLGLRWYVAGHAPWSNGYESMVFIGWAIMMAGLLMMRKSNLVMPVTATFTGLVMMVAHLSWMNPQITNLVPVLQSYWLTLHVAVITAGYGFLGLGAILGFLSLLIMIFRNSNNINRLQLAIDELTIVNELALTAGLYFMTIGSFLGGIWANESWGRYWGWDAKETWSLITIVLYALVLHLRFIPGLKGKSIFNIASLITFSSVIMTYLGVNYYLVGMHSYAAGEAVPIPAPLYYAVTAVVVMIGLALLNEHKMKSILSIKR